MTTDIVFSATTPAAAINDDLFPDGGGLGFNVAAGGQPIDRHDVILIQGEETVVRVLNTMPPGSGAPNAMDQTTVDNIVATVPETHRRTTTARNRARN